jgi:hypothetical protein
MRSSITEGEEREGRGAERYTADSGDAVLAVLDDENDGELCRGARRHLVCEAACEGGAEGDRAHLADDFGAISAAGGRAATRGDVAEDGERLRRQAARASLGDEHLDVGFELEEGALEEGVGHGGEGIRA